MEIKALSKSVHISPRKVRLVADVLRGLTAKKALDNLAMIRKRAGQALLKTLASAIANAGNKENLKLEQLMIKSIDVTDAGSLKRFRASTRGRTRPYKRRSSHIRVTLEVSK